MSTDHFVTDPTPEGVSGYDDAAQELEAIVARLEGDSVSIDTLVAVVARFRELVNYCSRHLAGARVRVTELLAEVRDPAATATPGVEPAEPPPSTPPDNDVPKVVL